MLKGVVQRHPDVGEFTVFPGMKSTRSSEADLTE